MDQKALKTSWKQRLIIIIIAILLLGSTFATYILIVLSNNNSSSNNLSKLQDDYTAKQVEINNRGAELSNVYFDVFKNFRSNVKAYNAEAVNSTGVQKTDLKEGDGRELTTGDLNYFAYYIGWCPDESVFDSSFDDFSNPTALTAPIYAGQGLIEGWNEGVVGMKIGGVREIAIPGELAYGESREICGTTNSPLKFIVMPITDETLFNLNNELEQIYAQLVNAYYSTSGNSSSAAGDAAYATE
ncbi:FKBP-type peptidyl-prolyl cis-trans isomerase [Candidatus Saccharibacteria bacterium]|nr:FKBP-type peptidyl-prolyl cis-trans isomerase [Candidatus Saccharibacteria bacterium]